MRLVEYLTDTGLWTVDITHNRKGEGVLTVRSKDNDRYLVRAIKLPSKSKNIRPTEENRRDWKQLAEDFIFERGEFKKMAVKEHLT